MSSHSPLAHTLDIAPGVVRLSWAADLGEQLVSECCKQVREFTEEAFKGGAQRVEAHVAPGDDSGQRVATFSGLMREGIARGVCAGDDRVVYARVTSDKPLEDGQGFRTLLNSFLPRKRGIGQMLIRDEQSRVLLCELTYKHDFDLPGGVIEVNESPRLAVTREVEEELGLNIQAGSLLLTDWLPAWSGWDDAICLVFDGGQHQASLIEQVTKQTREIKNVGFFDLAQVKELCADFTARRIEAALQNLSPNPGPAYTESGRN